MPLIDAGFDAPVGTITLNNAKKRNALSESLIQEVIAALADFRERKARVVILAGADGREPLSA